MSAVIIAFPRSTLNAGKLSDASYHAARAIALADDAANLHISELRAIFQRKVLELTRFLDFSQSGVQQLHNNLRVKFNARSVETLNGRDLPAAIELVDSLHADVVALRHFVAHLERGFVEGVIGGNEPWTGCIARYLGRPLDLEPKWRELAREISERKSAGE